VEERWAEASEAFTAEEHARLDRFETAASRMHPDERHWYLGIVGVDPSVRGRGHGRAVIRPGLDAADRDQLEVSLETVRRNLPFYERLGFRTAGNADLPDGPTLWGLRWSGRPS
jgi:predicted N-acetyltransferase YhbS